eukprot:jgi/Botrbrau1/2420/Bobra.0395s0045.2
MTLPKMVVITIKTLTGRPIVIEVDPELAVGQLRQKVARETGLPLERLKLVLKGKALTVETDKLHLQDNDVVLAVAAARAPPEHIKEVAAGCDNDEEEEELRFRLSPDAPAWQRSLVAFLRARVGLPDVFLIILFSIRPRSWIILGAWLVGFPLAARLEVMPPYLLDFLDVCDR